MSHVHAFPMHTYLFSIFLIYLKLLGTFLIVFLSLPLCSFTLVVFLAPKCKSTPARNPLHSDASSSTNPSPSTVQFRDDDAFKAFRRISLDEAFIRNAKSFCRTLPTLAFPLSFTVGNRSHCVTSRSHVLLFLSKSFTPTCTG